MTNQIDSFLNMMRAEVGASANTIDAYRRDLEQFEALVPVSGLQRHQRRRHCRVRSRAEPAKLCGEVGGPQAFGRQGFFQVFVYRKSDKKQSDNRYSDAQTRKTAAQIFDSGGSQAFNRYGRSRRKPGTAAAGGDAGTDVCLRLARVGAGVSA